jgi:hypothetical protein
MVLVVVLAVSSAAAAGASTAWASVASTASWLFPPPQATAANAKAEIQSAFFMVLFCFIKSMQS